jgi:hypothetical protein
MKSLCGSSWLIGFVIDAFLESFVQLGYQKPDYKFLKMPASYFTTARNDPMGMDAIAVAYATRFFTAESVQGADILMPAHRPGHWFEILISPTLGAICIIDHYYRDDDYREIYSWVLEWYSKLLSRLNLPVPTMRKLLHSDLSPQSMDQTDGNICGVFTAMSFAYIIHTGKLPSKSDFTNADGPALRIFMQFCIISIHDNQNLLGEYQENETQIEDRENEEDRLLRLAITESELLFAQEERKRFQNFSIEDVVDLSTDEVIRHLASFDIIQMDVEACKDVSDRITR